MNLTLFGEGFRGGDRGRVVGRRGRVSQAQGGSRLEIVFKILWLLTDL
jgi:hypothetical protein